MNIVVTGFMGTGKSSVGLKLASELRLEYVDTDTLIERESCMEVKDIFEEFGEEVFRRHEREIIKRTTTTMDGVVLSTGGGAVVHEANRAALRQWGTVVCLTASVDAIVDRVCKKNDRPLLSVEDRRRAIEDLLEHRAPYYEQADIVIDTTEKSVDEVVAEIIGRLE